MGFFVLEFYTPEEFFLGHKPVKFDWGSVDPLEIIKKHQNLKQQKEYHSTVKKNYFFKNIFNFFV